MYRLNVILVLCVLFFGGVAAAEIVVTTSSMDFQLEPDPDFDNDSSAVWFTEFTDPAQPYLEQDGSDANYWYFRGRQEYSSSWNPGGTGTTWFQKTGDEEYLEMDKTIVNNTSEAFVGYTITLRVATYVENSLNIDGVGYTVEVDAYQNPYYGYWITTITIVFDQAVLAGGSFDLNYALDLSGIAPPPPDDGEFGDEGGPDTPEPATLVVLMAGSFMLIIRRRRLRR